MKNPIRTSRQNSHSLPVLLTLAVLFVTAAACGTESKPRGLADDVPDVETHDVQDQTDTDSTSDTTPPTEDTTPDPISLTVLDASETGQYNGEYATDGHRLVLLEITLANGLDNEPLPASYELFSLKTQSGLIISSSQKSTSTTPACSPQYMLSAESDHTCILIFEVPHGSIPTSINYAAPDARSASADFETTPCTPCGKECIDLKTDLDHCGQCNATCTGECEDGTCDPHTYPNVDVALETACALTAERTVRCWGRDSDRLDADAPDGTFKQISNGNTHVCGIRDDGTLTCWGRDTDGAGTPPAGTFTQVFALFGRTCAIRTNGEIACWSKTGSLMDSLTPAGTFTHVVIDYNHACAIASDKTVHCWGRVTSPIEGFPESEHFTQIDGSFLYCGLKTDGKVTCWGEQSASINVPDDTFVQISTHNARLCGIRKSDRHPVCVGQSNSNNDVLPAVAVDQISAGSQNTCFVRSSDKKVICIGDNQHGILQVPDF